MEYMQEETKRHPGDSLFTTQELSEALQMQRSNLSKLLNELVKEQRIEKSGGRPVYYSLIKKEEESCFPETDRISVQLKTGDPADQGGPSVSRGVSSGADHRSGRIRKKSSGLSGL